MRALVLVLIVVAMMPSVSGAAGECNVPADCAVPGARCIGMRCTIANTTEVFPALALDEITLDSPPNLAVTQTSRPAFSWQTPMGVDLIAVVVFRHEPKYADMPDEISNFGDAVWVWHSRLPGADVSMSAIAFDEGRSVDVNATDPIDAHALLPGPPKELPAGAYYWGVWAWNGVYLVARSELRTFAVKAEDITGNDCTYCDPTECEYDDGDRVDYCVLPCASDVDCYEGESCDLSTVGQVNSGICRLGSATCSCAEPQDCDDKLQVCHLPPPQEGGCCSGSGAYAQGWFVLLVMLWLRRRRRRPAC